MADKAKKKAKHRLKREKKRLAARKNSALTPLFHLRRGEGNLFCMIVKDWQKEGIAGLYVLGSVGGHCVMAGFLIDIWCVGLKDVWGEAQILRVDFNDHMKQVSEKMPLVEIDPAKARELVIAAVAFSRKNGFKLPPNWQKWVGIFGDTTGDPDLSKFGKDGRLFYIGTEAFLRKRLIGTTVEKFMARPDVQVLFRAGSGLFGSMDTEDADDVDDFEDEDENSEDDAEGDDVEREFDQVIEQAGPALKPMFKATVRDLMLRTHGELQRRGIEPHPLLNQAIGYVASVAVSRKALKEMGADEPGEVMYEEAMNEIMVKDNVRDPDAMWDAINQVLDMVGEDNAAAEPGDSQ